MRGEELHLEIIGLAEPTESGTLHFPDEAAQRLRRRFQEALERPSFPAAVDGFVRAVAALQSAGYEAAAAQLIDLGAFALEAVQQKSASPTERLRSSVTGAESLHRMAPVGSLPAPSGVLKASAFARLLPKQR